MEKAKFDSTLAGVHRAARRANGAFVMRAAALTCGVFAVSLACVAQQQPPVKDLVNASIEDLMNVEVSSVSKTEQKLSHTAAAVFVITQEDIRRSNATNIPDLLRMVPGLDVAQINGSTWAISARGFNAQFSDKLLVMIDGRIVYTPNFAGVYWDTVDLPLEDIERIEVIRGPGGTAWGSNAVNGVISIYTKKAEDTRGGLIEVAGGNVEQESETTRYGGVLRSGTDFRVYSKFFNRAQMDGLNGQPGGDGWHVLRGGFRTDSRLSAKDTLTVEGDLYGGREGELAFYLPSITSPIFVPINHQVQYGGGAIQSLWKHDSSGTSGSTLEVSFNGYRRDDSFEPESRRTADLDFQNHRALGERNTLVWGAGARYSGDSIGGSLTVSFNPPSRAMLIFNAYAQDEIAVIPARLYITIGTKFEHNNYSGYGATPSVQLTWTPSDRHMFWASVSRALRTPSRNDTNLVVNTGSFVDQSGTLHVMRFLGNPNFRDEILDAKEAGYRTLLSRKLSLDVAAYSNDYDHLQTTEPSSSFLEASPPPAHIVDTVTFENFMNGETHGVEIAANLKASARWSVSAGYALELLHLHTIAASTDTTTPAFVEHGAPRHSAQLRSRFDIRRNVFWDTSVYFTDRLSHQGPSTVDVIPGYTRLDTGITYRIEERLSITGAGQNLLKTQHTEFEDIFGSMQSSRIKRGVYARVSWTF